MRPTPFPKDLRKVARKESRTMVRLQYMKPDGNGIEVVGAPPEWVVEKIDEILKTWAEVSVAVQQGNIQ